MKPIISGLIWASAMLAIGVASYFGLIERKDATNVILVLAILSALQISVVEKRECFSCKDASQ